MSTADTDTQTLDPTTPPNTGLDTDVVVVGAGFAGLYLIHKLRSIGLRVVAFEGADDVGGTWYWNRYPGARCDVPTADYSYSFDPELERDWQWSEKYATQPEILRYLQHVADRYDLRTSIRFGTRVSSAAWDGESATWNIITSDGTTTTSRFYVMATGCLSMPKAAEVAGAERFQGDVYFTSTWPHDVVDFTGRRVAVIGTGSSGVQSIPFIAEEASQLTVFQRTPNFSMPARNGPLPEHLAALAADRETFRETARWSQAGMNIPVAEQRVDQVDEAERLRRYEEVWQEGHLLAPSSKFSDLGVNPVANDTFAEFVRNKIRATVTDPATAEALCPTDHPFGTKRPCLDSGYYETFNLPHVTLVNLRDEPFVGITETGIDTTRGSYEFDAIVYATGFDAMTGAIVAVDIAGRDGRQLADRWSNGPHTYLGLMTHGFPNLFMITGPGSPSVLSNMATSIEQHVDWVTDCLAHMTDHQQLTIEPTPLAEHAWGVHVDDCAALTMFPQTDSWYMGANVPGKPRVMLPYIGGVGAYRQLCTDVVDQGYLGFRFQGPAGESVNDGVITRLQPDVRMVLEFLETLALPPFETLPPADARAMSEAINAERPTGPEVGEIIDGTYPAADGELAYRLYRPPTPGPHPIVAYYHGGGWVLGSATSDDPTCRDLCVRSNAIFVSVDYRHTVDAKFPAAVNDAMAALRWVSDHAVELGGIDQPVAVCGWSAGGNLAAVVSQLARDAGGPPIAGQVLITPVTNTDTTQGSYIENAEGYVLTRSLMEWFLDQYVD
ncbi:MAG TPA: alpha/beta hydrolase fold domain-containing protein, partial [Ilumatobacter sp.]|nr:alpha/beta hydrolase fold domain-containing protein [Ilumatobacter sp.]